MHIYTLYIAHYGAFFIPHIMYDCIQFQCASAIDYFNLALGSFQVLMSFLQELE